MKRLGLYLFVVLFLFSCKDELTESQKQNKYVNEWIYDNMSMLYYWNEELPAYKSSYGDPSDYFLTLINDEDRFSAIFDDYEEIQNQLNGVNTSDVGFDFQLYIESSANDNVLGQVVYLKPGTNAAGAGVKRGDIFRQINGTQITLSNYSTLISKFYDSNSEVSVTFADIVNRTFVNRTPVTITKAMNYKENPVYFDTIYTVQNKKIGYLIYNFFADDSGDDSKQFDLELNDVFMKFKTEPITDLIVDLRYNSGGYLTAAVHLASMMVPDLTSGKLFSYTEFNQNYTDYFNSDAYKNKYTDDPFKDYFYTTISVNSQYTPINNVGQNIQRIYFLTGRHTASASEMVINGLKPFLPCVLIGDTTVGKNVGSTLVYDTDNATNKWAFMPIILKYFNKDHQSDFSNGFAPDFYLYDDVSHDLGDVNEELLAKAISEITGAQAAPQQFERVTHLKRIASPVFKFKSELVVKKRAVDAYFESKKR